MELDLKELIDRLTSIYEQFGNITVVVERNILVDYATQEVITDVEYKNLSVIIKIEK